MAIQLAIMQSEGVNATYHVPMFLLNAQLAASPNYPCVVNSYTSQAAFAAGDSQLGTTTVDLTPFFTNPVQAGLLNSQIDNWIIANIPAFAGGTQVS